jgi:hypothetical protein
MKVYIAMEQVESLIVQILLHEVLGCATAIILVIFFCKVKNLPAVGRVTPKNCSIFYNRRKVCIVNLFESVNAAYMDH